MAMDMLIALSTYVLLLHHALPVTKSVESTVTTYMCKHNALEDAAQQALHINSCQFAPMCASIVG